MAADRPHKPTAKRLRDARKRGEVAHSKDVSGALSFAAVVAALGWAGTATFEMLRGLWQYALSPEMLARPGIGLAGPLSHALQVLMWSSLPLVAVVAVVAVVGGFLQVGGLMAWSRIKPDVKRLSPAEGLKRIFSTENALNLLKMVVKAALLSGLMFVAIRATLDTALKLGYFAPAGVMQVGSVAVESLLAWAAAIYLVMSAFDYAVAHYEFMKKQRMSIDDLRREHKETEGDPVNAGRRRFVRFEAVYRALDDRVRASSALICSGSTAVALQYLGEKDLPRVIARGVGDAAAQMRRIAGQASIPIAFDAALSGRLYDEVPEGQAIPRSLYKPVAELLRWAQGRD